MVLLITRFPLHHTTTITVTSLMNSPLNEPEKDDVAKNVVLVLVHLVGPAGRLIRQVLVHQPPAHQVAQQVAERSPGRGTKTDLEKRIKKQLQRDA